MSTAGAGEKDDVLNEVILFITLLVLPQDCQIVLTEKVFEPEGQNILFLRGLLKIIRNFNLAPALRDLSTATTLSHIVEK